MSPAWKLGAEDVIRRLVERRQTVYFPLAVLKAWFEALLLSVMRTT